MGPVVDGSISLARAGLVQGTHVARCRLHTALAWKGRSVRMRPNALGLNQLPVQRRGSGARVIACRPSARLSLLIHTIKSG